MAKNIKLGQVLVESGYINEQQLEEALRIQQSSKGKKLGSILLDIGIITEEQLMDALQRRLNVPLADIRNITVPMEVVQLMSEEFARENSMLPIRQQGNTVIIATSDPLNYNAINEFEVQSGRIAVLQLASQQDIENAINRVYSSSAVNETAFSAVEQLTSEDLGNVSINEAELRASSAPVVRLVNQLIEQAYKQRASDIHIEPYESTVRIRMRIDGELKEVATIKPALLGPILTRIKIAANLDIAEKRIPQDGRISIDIEGTRLNLRVSTIATVYGEKAVLRLLSDSKSGILTMSELGMNEHNSELLHSLLRSPNGIILVTGPTGSGKTTTLYAAVAELSQPTMNIVSVEDPVEKVLPGINQTQINPKAGLTFASGLRALLRQDPDIMLVGEIRDEETAQIAAAAAITGHLVLSSLHTNDAASAYMRFIDMGVAPYIVASSIVGIVAQRLVKKICPHCAQSYAPSRDEQRLLDTFGIGEVKKLYRGSGCVKCDYSGSSGRTAIYEIIKTDANIRALVTEKVKAQEIRTYMDKRGFEDMRFNAVQLMKQGIITFDEMLKKTYSVESIV